MDPAYGHDDGLTAGADLMVSPDLGGKQLPSESADDELRDAAEKMVEPEKDAPKDDDQEPEEDHQEDEPLAAEDRETEQDENEPDDSDDDQAPSGDRYTVKVDGEDIEVSLDDLKQGYSGQKYVQQGMQKAAATQKEAEAIYNSLQNERRQLAEFAQQVQQGVRPPPPEPDKALFQSDPLAYMDQKIKYDTEKEQFDQQMGQLQQVTQQQGAADQQAMQHYLQGELTQLQAIDPDFRDPEKAGKLKEKMLTQGNEIYGYTPEEIGQIVDHRAIRVLRDAMRYHEIKKGKSNAQEKVQHKMVKGRQSKRPTTGESRRRKQKERFGKSGDIKDAVDLMFK